jgi:hypothetical protein
MRLTAHTHYLSRLLAEMLADPALGSTNMFSEKLAAELGLPVFVTMPNIKQLIDELGWSKD